jgi:hypothetical protein
MSVTPKDMAFGAAAAAAFLGLVVYNQHKFNKLQAEIDHLKDETRTMAQYIRILESKVAGDFHTILTQDKHNHSQEDHQHHHHHAHGGHPQQPEAPKVVQPVKPAIEEAKPEVPLITKKPAAVVRQPVRTAPPVKQPIRTNPPRANPVVKKVAPVARPVQRKPIVVEDSTSSDEDQKDEETEAKEEPEEISGDESSSEATPQNSNRRGAPVKTASVARPVVPSAGVRSMNQPRNPVPRAAAALKATPTPPNKPQHVITVEEGKPPKDKEESYNPAEDNNRATEISGGRPTPPKAGGPRTTGPKSGGAAKRFGPKTDESEDSDKFVSSSKTKGKSILKNPSSNQITNGAKKDTEEKENSIDADLADDMAMVASKSSKRAEDNEGREVGQTEARMKMAKTAQIADAMKKRAEERAKKISESSSPGI